MYILPVYVFKQKKTEPFPTPSVTVYFVTYQSSRFLAATTAMPAIITTAAAAIPINDSPV